MSLIENKSLIRAEQEQFVRAVSVVSTQIHTKAQLGAVVQSFDPDAIDGDGDGLVQDGSPFERPAVIGAISKASQRLGQILGKAKQTKQGRTKEHNRRYSGQSAKDIAVDVVPDSFEGWAAKQYELLRLEQPELPAFTDDISPAQVKDMVRALEDFVEPDLVWMLSEADAEKYKELKKTDRNAAFRFLTEGAFDFSPKAVAKNRRLVEHVLTTNPQFRELVNRFGMPTLTLYGPNMSDSHMAAGFFSERNGISLNWYRSPTSQGKINTAGSKLANWFMTGILTPDVGSKKTKRWLSRSSPEGLLVHEYGHYLSDMVGRTMSDDEKRDMSSGKAAGWRFSIGSDWKETFEAVGWPEAYDKYSLPLVPDTDINARSKKKRDRRDVPSDIPHILTGYGESAPAEAWAESIAALIAHGGEDKDLVSEGMTWLVRDVLDLDDNDIREQLTPKRAAREIVPDGFASRGATVEINNERDPRFGDLDDPYELTATVLGTLDGDDPVGKMVRRLQGIKDDPVQYGLLVQAGNEDSVDVPLNIRVANEAEAALLAEVLITDPAFADMIRRHGIPNFYFSQTDLKLKGDFDVRGILSGGYVADDSPNGKFYPPRIVIDLIGAPHERGTLDTPFEPDSRADVQEYSKGRAPGNITRKFVSRSDKHVIRHEGGHGVLDQLWERQYEGKIKGRRAQLIRAYSKSTWEEFYKELGRPDLWAEHQRALRATYPSQQGTLERAFRRVIPGNPNISDEVQQVDSAYAWSNPKEMFAEGFSAYTASNPEFRGLLNDTMLDHLQSILGDADTDIPEPPSMPESRDLGTDIPEPPAWDGFASTGAPIESYSDLRRNWVGMISGNEQFTRREFFENTTTEQKLDLAVPTNEREWALMAWDQQFEQMGLTWDEVNRFDLSDPFNPEMPDERNSLWLLGEEWLEQFGLLMKLNAPDLSPENVQANREALRAALDSSPRFRAASERHGLPPIATMSNRTAEKVAMEGLLDDAIEQSKAGKKINPEILDILPAYIKWKENDRYVASRWDEFRQSPEGVKAQKLAERWTILGGYNPATGTITLSQGQVDKWKNGTRLNRQHSPEAGDWLIADNSFESVLLHEFAHHIDFTQNNNREAGAYNASFALSLEGSRLFADADKHIKTRYGRTEKVEFAAESIAAVLSGSRDQEEMLSPEARRWARSMAGLPENDPVFAGRTRVLDNPAARYDQFGNAWVKLDGGDWTAVRGGERSRDGIPDVIESMAEAKERTGLTNFEPVVFEHDGRTFTTRQVNDTFSIEINGRTVATANVVEDRYGMPEIQNVDVLPGYTGVAADKDLHEMVVDHARKKYPSALAPVRARQAAIHQDGFASVGPEHHDARQIDGTAGTPEYAQAVAGEFEAAQATGKKVFFDYNGETREVEVTEVFTKNGILYMRGNDALRNGEERMFRLDRVSMPKRVENPDTGAAEVVKKPGKPPRKPVPVFTGKAAELFEGAASWEEVAARLGKGRYVFFDFETTGIEEDEFGGMKHPGTPTQIGLTEIVDGKITRQWSTHVNPGRPLSIDPKTGRSWSADNLRYKDPDTGELVNINDEWLAKQKSLSEALEEMLEFIGPIEDTILGGQNHPYDDDVMKRAMADSGLDPARWNPGGFIDSQALAQALLDKSSDDYPKNEKGTKTVSLGYLAKFLGHDMGEGWHSADADAEASYESFKRLIERAALHENSGKPVRRDLFAPGGALKEHKERLDDYERQQRGYDYKVKKYKEQAAAAMESPATEGFASRGAGKVRDFIEKRRRAKDPASWKNLTPEQRDAATKSSAEAAVAFLNALRDSGVDLDALKTMNRAELDATLTDIIAPGGEARVSDYVAGVFDPETGEPLPIIEVSNATMGKVFMSLGFHVQVISDEPNEHHILENGINDMQKALQDYGAAVAKDPEKLLRDVIFRDWAANYKDPKTGLPAPIDVSMIGKEGGMDVSKAAKLFAETFEIDLCLYYKAGSNMICGANIGIEREQMPQLGGRMKGDDTLAAKAIKTGLMAAKEFKIDKKKLGKLDPEKQKELSALANNPAKVAELAKANDPLAKELFDVLNWNDTEASVESIADRAAKALGIAIDDPRFVDPATMLGAQNQLQGSKVETMADGATAAFLETILNLNDKAIPILDDSVMTDEWIMNKFGVDKDGVPKIRTQIDELRTIAADPARYKELAEKGDKRLMDMGKIMDSQAAADLIKANPAIATPEKIDEYLDYLANVRRHGLFQPTLTAGIVGEDGLGQIYMLDGHHRWSGLLMANKKLEDLGLDARVKLNIKNYQTDIRSGLELGRTIQVAMGVKDAKLTGEDDFVFNPDAPDLTPEEFDKIISEMIDPAKIIERLREVREGGKFRETEAADVPGDQAGGQAERLKPRKKPLAEVVREITGQNATLEPQSRITGVKPQQNGYRAIGTGMEWSSVEDHVAIETERGNPLFDTYKEYVDKGYEVVWVTHDAKEAGRYAVSADQVNALDQGEISIDAGDIGTVDLAGATLVGKDDEGGFLYARKKPTKATRQRIETLKSEEEYLDGFASIGSYPQDRDGRTRPGDRYPFDVRPSVFDKETLDNLSIDITAQEADNVLDNSPSFMLDEREIKKVEAAIKRLEGMGERGKKRAAKLRRDLEGRLKNEERWRERMGKINIEPVRPYVGKPGDKPGKFPSGSSFPQDEPDWLDGPEDWLDKPGDYDGDYDGFGSTGSPNAGSSMPQVTQMTAKERRLHSANLKKVLDTIELPDDVMKDLSYFDKNNTNARDNAANIYLHSLGVDLNDPEAVKDALNSGFADWMSDKTYSEIETLSEVTPNEWDNYLGIGPRRSNVSPEELAEMEDLIAQRRIAKGQSDDGFASTGEVVPLDVVAGGPHTFDSDQRGGPEQRDQEVVADDWKTRQQKRIAGVRVPERKVDELGAPKPGAPIYRETVKIGLKQYTFEVDADGIVSVYTGRKYKQVAQLNLDRGHSMEGSRRHENPGRHFIDMVMVDRKHRRKGIATYMAEMAEHAYGGKVEHSTALTSLGKKWRDADVEKRGATALPLPEDFDPDAPVLGWTPGDTPPSWAWWDSEGNDTNGFASTGDSDGFASRGGTGTTISAQTVADTKERRNYKKLKPRYFETENGEQLELYHSDLATNTFMVRLGDKGVARVSVIEDDNGLPQITVMNIQPGYDAAQIESELTKYVKEYFPDAQPAEGKARVGKTVSEPGVASRGNYQPLSTPGDDEAFSTDSTLEKLADKMGLDQLPDGRDQQMTAITGRLYTGTTSESTLAEKLGITPEQLREQIRELAENVNDFVDRFVNDKNVRKQVKYGYKAISLAAMLLGMKGMKDFMAMMNPNLSGGGNGSGESSSLLDIIDHVLGAGIHEALIAYGSNFANLLATEYAAMRLATQEKMKQMITDIKARIEGTGQKIGVMSTEMWNRLRGAWKLTRSKAPIAVPASAKKWIVAGSTPAWAEMAWIDYQSKSRVTSGMQPTNIRAWADIVSKVGQSPELIDIATYRAGFGYGEKRIKSRDVVRVYLIAEKSLGQTLGEMSASQSTSSGQEIDGDGDGFVATTPGGPDETPKQKQQSKPKGQLEKGNIDLTNRPIVKNSDGSISTVRSITITDGKTAVLIPSVIRKPDGTGKVVSNNDAIKHYRKTGEHLGKFNSINNANSYAEQLHKDQAKRYVNPVATRIMARNN